MGTGREKVVGIFHMAEMGEVHVHVVIKQFKNYQYCVVAKEKLSEVATESYENDD